MPNSQYLQAFISALKKYFEEISFSDIEIGIPSVKNKDELLEYTGTIAISGIAEGAIYITLPKDVLTKIASAFLGSSEVNEDDITDMTGEFTNTIAGSVRRELGSNFNISVPLVINGKPSKIVVPKLRSPTYVIPFKVNGSMCYLYVGIDF